ncbi:MAG: molybdate ABC transporter substrate-binding protein [Actinomycetota bacterium]|nr:molybdate ABC transporter substrate-binding protein [Actinomycetota bacterium]
MEVQAGGGRSASAVPVRGAGARTSAGRAVVRLLLGVVPLLLSACGAAGGSQRLDATRHHAGAGSLTVLAPTSLREPLGELADLYERQHPGSDVTLSFGTSRALTARVRQGAPADVLVTTDDASMQAVRDRVAGRAQVLARNRLALVHEPGNPLRFTGLADLARPGVRVVLPARTVPTGREARAALAQAGVSVAAVAEVLSEQAVVDTVRRGRADAGIAYVTDVRAVTGQVEGIDLPGVSNRYLGAVLTRAPHAEAAPRFLELVVGSQGRAVLERYGFLPPV